jgi:TPR repeat protein
MVIKLSGISHRKAFCLIFACFWGKLENNSCFSAGDISSESDTIPSQCQANLLDVFSSYQCQLALDVERYKKGANDGNLEDLVRYGLCLFLGEGVPIDRRAAAEYFKQAACGWDPIGLYSYGYCFLCGGGVEQDLAEAANLFLLSAEQGYTPAQFRSGRCFELGEGVTKNLIEAVEYYKSAADSGYLPAKYALLDLLMTTDNTETELCTFVSRYARVANQDAWAACVLGFCSEHGKFADKNLTAALTYYESSAFGGDELGREHLIRFIGTESVSIFSGEVTQTTRVITDEGHAWKQYFIGCCKEVGGYRGEKNLIEAARYYWMSADSGNLDAQVNLIRLLNSKNYASSDLRQIIRYYANVAIDEYAWAQFINGICLDNRRLGFIDEVEAFRCYEASARQGNPWGRDKFLSSMTKQYDEYINFDVFVNGYRVLADSGDAFAQCVYGHCLMLGKGSYRFGEDIPVNEPDAVRYYKLSAEQGDAHGEVNYGACLEKGLGCDVDLLNAVKFYRRSANQGNALGQINYARCLELGIGGIKDLPEAAKYCRLSARRGNAMAQAFYGRYLEFGIGMAVNLVEAAKYYKRAADQGNTLGLNAYGRCLRLGLGVAVNLEEAAEYYKRSAELGSSIGQATYGQLLQYGIGVAVDLNESNKYLSQAAAQGVAMTWAFS